MHPASSLRLLAALLAGSSCATPPAPAPEIYAVLESCARAPEMRRAVCQIIADDLQPEGRGIALSHRGDDDPLVRKSCYVWLLSMDGDDEADWLAEGLNDPSAGVRALCLIMSERVQEWTEADRAGVRRILRSCRMGHVFRTAALAWVRRGGHEAALEVHQIVAERGAGWQPYACAALALHPVEAFRPLFTEVAATTAGDDPALLARRALRQLDAGPAADDPSPGERTSDEFHALWSSADLRGVPPEVVDRQALILELRSRRAVVLGELHGWPPLRAAQCEILAELVAAHGSELVLVCETPVLEVQQPLIAVAEQYGIEPLCLESEEMAQEATPDERDVFVRAALAAMAVQQPEKHFLVCYGENHRRSLQTALQEAGVSCASVALYPNDGMLGAAVRLTGGRIQEQAFRYPGDRWFLPVGSYGALLGCPGLDAAFRASGSPPAAPGSTRTP